MEDVLGVSFSDFTTDWEKAMGIGDLDLSDVSNASSKSDGGFSPILTPPVSCHS